jgi:hypothetical protein
MNNMHPAVVVLTALMTPLFLASKKLDIRFSRTVFMVLVIAFTSYILLNSQISFAANQTATIANQTATIANQTAIVNGTRNIQFPCADPETGRPQLPCPPPGKCLGPDDRPIPCPKPGQCLGPDNKPIGCPRLNLSIEEIFEKQTGGNNTTFNGTKYSIVHNLTGTIGEITDQYYKLGQEFDKKSGIKPGDPVTFVFRNNSIFTVPYTGNYKNPIAEDLLEDIFSPLDGPRPCWITVETTTGLVVQRHFPSCSGSTSTP